MAATREQAEQDILDKASKDPAFRQKLIDDPRATLEAELGIALPAGVEVSVVQETASKHYLVLPRDEVAAGTELSEEALASVAGAGGSGNSWNDPTCIDGNCG